MLSQHIPTTIAPAEQALFYQAKTTGTMWDTWLYWHEGTHYLFHLVGPGGQWYGIAMATSRDGVHWREHGLVIEKAAEATWLGTGTVWAAAPMGGKPRFLMNFSEWKGAGQTIFFAESEDLLSWRRLDRSTEFLPDGRWYKTSGGNDGRWDCISTIPRPGGGRYGFWTANPHHVVGFGFGESDDGLSWRALPPPRIDWGRVPAMTSIESGAVAEIHGRFFTMLGSPGQYLSHICGMFTCVADKPEGPYTPAATNYALLTSSGNRCHTYFARFYPCADGLLVNHHAVSCTGDVFFAPLKATEVDAQQVLRLTWWPGNAVALERWTHQALDPSITPDSPSQLEFPPELGFYLEGRLDPQTTPDTSAALVYISCTEGHGGVRFNMHPSGVVEIAVIFADGRLEPLERIDRTLPGPAIMRFRLLILHGFVELYLNDYLIQVHSLHAAAAGRIAIHGLRPTQCLSG
jgi:hypothetical protein